MTPEDVVRAASARGLAVTVGPRAALPDPPPPPAGVDGPGWERAVMRLARDLGWAVAHFRPALTRAGRWYTPVSGDGAGLPDLLCVRDRRVLWVELKTGKGRLSATQRAWRDRLRAAGQEWHLFRPSDWDLLLEVLR